MKRIFPVAILVAPILFMPFVKSMGFSSESFVYRLWLLLILVGPVFVSYHMATKEQKIIAMPRKPLYRIVLFFLMSVLWVVRYSLLRIIGLTVGIGIDIVLAVVGIAGVLTGAGYLDAIKEAEKASLFEMVLFGVFPSITGLLVVPLWQRLFGITR